MRAKPQVIEDTRAKVPAYIVTFSDMVTLLLTFFVMLLSLANMQDPELFHRTRNAFNQSIGNFGLGLFEGPKIAPDFGEFKRKYYVEDVAEEPDFRTIDTKEQDLRRIFTTLSQSMETRRSEIVAEKNNFSVTNIRFSPGGSKLNESAKKFLTQFAVNLQHDTNSGGLKLYVLGFARDVKGEKGQWILSAVRARAVADFLKGLLPVQMQCPVYSWGGGPGGHWVTRDSSISDKSQILISVLRGN